MAEITLLVSCPLFKEKHKSMDLTNVVDDIIETLANDVAKQTAKEIESKIRAEVEHSVQLAAFIGQNTDPEAIKTIINGIKVIAERDTVIVKYEDDLKSLHGEPPPELFDMLRSLIDAAVQKMSVDDIGRETLRDQG